MSDLIDREDVIRIAQDRLNSPYMQNKWQQGACLSILRAIEELPSADVVSLEEFEQMRFLADKSMEMVGEERPKGEWTSVLAELHERFDALEKELRKASAEMSAIIREYVDRPQGEQIAIGAVCEVICKHCIKANGCCQHHWKCPLLTEIAKLIEPKDEPQTEREGE